MLSTRNVRVMITSVAMPGLISRQKTEQLPLDMDDRLMKLGDWCEHGIQASASIAPVLETSRNGTNQEVRYIGNIVQNFTARFLTQVIALEQSVSSTLILELHKPAPAIYTKCS